MSIWQWRICLPNLKKEVKSFVCLLSVASFENLQGKMGTSVTQDLNKGLLDTKCWVNVGLGEQMENKTLLIEHEVR